MLVGLGLLVPPLGHLLERPFYRFPQRVTGTGGNGFVLGIALGAVFVPCAGPVLAAITVAGATGHIGLRTIGLTLGFAVGTAIPLLAFALAGRSMTQRLGAFRRHQGAFRAVSGVGDDRPGRRADVQPLRHHPARHPELHASRGQLPGEGRRGRAPGRHGSVSLQDCQTAALYGGSGLEQCGAAPAFNGIQQWFNTPGGKPVSLASLKGKVVLVDFWAYSCINCQRELPHVEAWYKDYAADGLEVVGVHTPEYAFEHVPSNVDAGVRRLGLTFPVALDNSYDTWNAYDNQSWPAAYLIDATGQIRHISIGEGDYTGEEQLIRQLLAAAHPGIALPKATDLPDTTPTDQSQTPETYLGAEREQGYAGSTTYATGPFTAARRPARELLRPVRHLDHRPAVDHRGQGRRDQARLPRLLRLPRRRRHRHAHRLLRRQEQGHPRLRRPRHLHRRHRAARAGRHRDHRAVTGAAGLLLHLRLTAPRGALSPQPRSRSCS